MLCVSRAPVRSPLRSALPEQPAAGALLLGCIPVRNRALELDARERELMFSQGVDTPDAIQFAASGSVNVDESGNFSITVLSEALRRFCAGELMRITD